MVKKKGLKKFNISNRLAYTLMIILSIALLGIGVYANSVGVKPNPGHLTSELSPDSSCSSGQVLSWNGANFVCTTPSSGGLSCVLRTQSCPSSSGSATGGIHCSVNCNSGQTLTGGGCFMGGSISTTLKNSYPSSTGYWVCDYEFESGYSVTATAICCS